MSWGDDSFASDFEDGPEGFADHAEDWNDDGAVWERESGPDFAGVRGVDEDELETTLDQAYVSGWRDGWEDSERGDPDADVHAVAAEFDGAGMAGVSSDTIHEAFDEMQEFFDGWSDAQLPSDESDTLQHPEDIEADKLDDEDEHRHDTGPGTK